MQVLINARNGVPFYRQIIVQAKVAIARGDFRPDNRLPTVHQLAADLSVSRTGQPVLAWGVSSLVVDQQRRQPGP